MLLFYRGSWCPYCNAQLRAFQRAGGVLADAGVRVAALSVDDEAATAALIAERGLTFPVGYGADAGNAMRRLLTRPVSRAACVQAVCG